MEKAKEWTRRRFVKAGAVAAGGVAALGPGAMFAHNELMPVGSKESQWIHEAHEKGHSLDWVGLWPDFENPHGTPWKDTAKMKEALGGKIQFIGAFTGLNELQNPRVGRRDVERCNAFRTFGAVPVVTIGADDMHSGLHPLHPSNFDLLSKKTENAAKTLDGVDGLLIVRWLIEAPNPYSKHLGHGRGGGLSDSTHEQMFRESFAMASEAFKNNRKGKTLMAFCPYAIWRDFTGQVMNPFKNYIPVVGDKLYADLVGFNIFSLYPGSGRFTNSRYWLYGRKPAEELIGETLWTYKDEVPAEVPNVIWEIGNMDHDPDLLHQILLYGVANGVKGAMHLNYDKEYKDAYNETRWNMTPEELEIYGKLVREVGGNRII